MSLLWNQTAVGQPQSLGLRASAGVSTGVSVCDSLSVTERLAPVFYHVLVTIWPHSPALPSLRLRPSAGVSTVAWVCTSLSQLEIEKVFFHVLETRLPCTLISETESISQSVQIVEFARAQVASQVWVCGNILWEVSSSKAFYKAEAVAA